MEGEGKGEERGKERRRGEERGKERREGRRGEREGEKKERRGGDTTTYIILSHPYLGIEPLLVLIPKWRITHQQNIENYTWSRGEMESVFLNSLGHTIALSRIAHHMPTYLRASHKVLA